jgi:gamma-glutamyl:cysteine ligase YbdK (ATP-grasp superfamily)
MGLAIDRDRFEDEDYHRFDARLASSLGVLEDLLARPDFGEGAPSLGAELEVALVDRNARPLPLNIEVLRETLDPRMTVELNRFNLECNLRHTVLAGRSFTTLHREFEDGLGELVRAAQMHEGRVAMIGILPTLEVGDLQSSAMTDTARFRALSWALQRARQEPFVVRIDGLDPLEVTCDDVTFEGAATSLQVHLRVRPGDFAATFNAVQLATAPALAVAGNSPTFLGHRLWEETRVALFKQAVDDRGERAKRLRRRPRVCFGSRWIREGALELFSDAVVQYPALLPVLGKEDPEECLRSGGIPRLEEIRLHQGTVWHWNRPVYDHNEGGHLRIEMRALPAGPSVPDMLANAAFLLGLALELAPRMEDLASAISFQEAHNNFYRAAQSGLEAELSWPEALEGRGSATRVLELVPRLLPLARRGLGKAGVDAGDIEATLGVIEERCESRRTGAVWQRAALAELESSSNRRTAAASMLERYLSHSHTGMPVHRWPVRTTGAHG